jgi:hypothetical protein
MMPKTIDLATLTDAQLHIFYENALERGAIDLAVSIARELFRLGKLKRAELAKLRWNERAVAEILQPFADVARTVVRNSRTTYTNGGGLRRKPKADPERMMVDSYCHKAREDQCRICWTCERAWARADFRAPREWPEALLSSFRTGPGLVGMVRTRGSRMKEKIHGIWDDS